MNNFDTAFKKVIELVEDFRQNEKRYLSPEYQEAEVRRDYIDKFFEAIGWDVYHNTQKNPYEQEVKVEKGVSIGKAQKRADYAFYITPEFRQPKFYAEAKKPSRNLKNADDYFQTIRYGWSAKTPVAVLTDFEEFHVLDCRFKPNIKNVLDNPNHKSFLFSDYITEEKFKEIYFLFSRDAVHSGSLEKYSDSLPKPKGKKGETAKAVFKAIDDDFLEYIDEVRERLAKAFKKSDSNLSGDELTEATQRTIDRIVFIRFLEDKLIEPEYIISEFGKRGNAWNDFITVSRKLDAKYNGIVFKKHFIDEQNFTGPEVKEFSKICEDISHLNSPYDFNAIPIHILGSIYERFLGKVVNATAQRVKVEEKPEVRKAGGVYYTPKYIVDYIVENTVGKILRNENNGSSSNLSFPNALIGNPEIKTNKEKERLDSSLKRAGMTNAGGAGMTDAEKGKTPQEISKLRFADIACGSGSFLIGVFDTLLKYYSEYYQAHPTEAKKDGCIEKDGKMVLSIKQKQNILLNNIYGVDIDSQAVEVTQLSLALKMLEDESTATANDMQVLFHEKILPDLSKNIVCGNSLIGTDILYGNMFASDDERKLNPMDFETMFPDVMKHGGFDAIVGNPPYVQQSMFDWFNLNIKRYLLNNYCSSMGRLNTFGFFIEKAIKNIKSNGKLGYIIPNTILSQEYYEELREYILSKTFIDEIVNYESLQFKGAVVETITLILSKEIKDGSVVISNINKGLKKIDKKINIDVFKQAYKKQFNVVGDEKDIIFQKKIENNCTAFKELVNVNQGIALKEDRAAYLFDSPNGNNFKKILDGREINKYSLDWKGKYLKYDINAIHSCKREDIFNTSEKLIFRRVSATLIATYDTQKFYTLNTLIVINLRDSLKFNLKFILGLFNSKFLNWYYIKFFKSTKKVFSEIQARQIEQLPIPKINFQNESEKHSHDIIVSLVDQMLEAKKQQHTAKTDKDKTYYERKCENLDHQIDSEVYKLYGLTEEEIKIVEGLK